MTERPPAPEPDALERHPDYLPEPDFFDEADEEGPEDQAPEPAPGDEAA